jgi:hypothetical protein
MKTLIIQLIIICGFCLQLHDAQAQIHASRNLFHKIVEDTVNVGTAFAQSGFSMDLNRGLGDMSAGEQIEKYGLTVPSNPNRDRAWNIKLGGYSEFYRYSPRKVLVGYAYHELILNALNDISFNPRAAVWEERIELRNAINWENAAISFGIFHRCKHDIDNSDNEFNDTPDPTTLKKRVVILTGLSAQLTSVSQNYTLLEKLLGVPVLFTYDGRVEFYANSSDYRFPFTPSDAVSWRRARASGMIQGLLEASLTNKSTLYLKLYSSGMFFLADGNKNQSASFGTNQRVELGYSYAGKNAHFQVFLVNERLFDDPTRIISERVNVISLGVRTNPLGVW